jgi:CheY-like chemotaxis protein
MMMSRSFDQPLQLMAKRLRILHLEDSLEDSELVQFALAENGVEHEMNAVGTKARFLAALESGRFDVILSDSSVPGFDGKAALALTRTWFPETPFIFVSGHEPDDEALAALKEAGATDFVSKSKMHLLAKAVLAAFWNMERE